VTSQSRMWQCCGLLRCSAHPTLVLSPEPSLFEHGSRSLALPSRRSYTLHVQGTASPFPPELRCPNFLYYEEKALRRGGPANWLGSREALWGPRRLGEVPHRSVAVQD
jgi:hypothetical protein